MLHHAKTLAFLLALATVICILNGYFQFNNSYVERRLWNFGDEVFTNGTTTMMMTAFAASGPETDPNRKIICWMTVETEFLNGQHVRSQDIRNPIPYSALVPKNGGECMTLEQYDEIFTYHTFTILFSCMSVLAIFFIIEAKNNSEENPPANAVVTETNHNGNKLNEHNSDFA